MHPTVVKCADSKKGYKFAVRKINNDKDYIHFFMPIAEKHMQMKQSS